VIKNQHVQCAQQISTAFSSGTGDGLLGLAFKMVNRVTPEPVPTPVDNLNTEGVTPKVWLHPRSQFLPISSQGSELFTCMLTRHTEEPGFYTFGFIPFHVLSDLRVHRSKSVRPRATTPLFSDCGQQWVLEGRFSCSHRQR